MSFMPLFVLLQAEAPSQLIQFAPFILIFFIFYFLLIRPQQKKQREQEEMIAAVEKGDDVMTAGGLHGKVVGTTDDILTVEIAALKGERVRVKIARNKIETVKRGEES